MSTETNPADYDTFYQSTAGFIIPTVTGAISCVSSLTIIFIIDEPLSPFPENGRRFE
jgi:hypothetical protein